MLTIKKVLKQLNKGNYKEINELIIEVAEETDFKNWLDNYTGPFVTYSYNFKSFNILNLVVCHKSANKEYLFNIIFKTKDLLHFHYKGEDLDKFLKAIVRFLQTLQYRLTSKDTFPEITERIELTYIKNLLLTHQFFQKLKYNNIDAFFNIRYNCLYVPEYYLTVKVDVKTNEMNFYENLLKVNTNNEVADDALLDAFINRIKNIGLIQQFNIHHPMQALDTNLSTLLRDEELEKQLQYEFGEKYKHTLLTASSFKDSINVLDSELNYFISETFYFCINKNKFTDKYDIIKADNKREFIDKISGFKVNKQTLAQ